MSDGYTASEIARLTGIPRSTIRDWRNGRLPTYPTEHSCLPAHIAALDERSYAYLLAMYLGDGCISSCARTTRLRVTLDAAYPGIVGECAAAIGAVVPGKRASVWQRRDAQCVDVSTYWNHWPCLLPQHGAGPKHRRRIELVDWQQEIVGRHTRAFLRGLIHSDGARIVATERKGAYVRRAPRYCFSNRSEDILALFRTACEALDIHCTRSSVKQISVYSKAAVAALDLFVGPKR